MTANYVLLEKITVGSAGASSVTFSGIPQTGYTDLVVKVSARLSSTDSPILVNFNGSNTSYTWKRIYGNGSSASSLSGSDGYFLHGDTSSMTANTFSSSELYIPNYTGSNYKSVSTDTALETNATAGELFMLSSLWSNTSAITSISLTALTGSLVQYSTFYLYGVAKLGTTPAIVPYATGGDTIMTDGTYWYHAFKASGTFTPSAIALTCDVLVVAGGGGGGAQVGGGGGAGGIFYTTAQAISTAQTVTIGAGGTGGVVSVSKGVSGSNSTFASLTAAVGGGGGGSQGTNLDVGVNGGSGGGGGSNSGGTTYAGGSSTQTGTGGTGYGNAGGSTSAGFVSGGGGGGSGAVGTNSTSGTGGVGGAGLNTWSAWLNSTGTGVSGYIAGGGGGGSNTTTAVAGGSGGGGAGGGGSTIAPVAGTANTGSGGGGTRDLPGSGEAGGRGGSGLVVVRYAV